VFSAEMSFGAISSFIVLWIILEGSIVR